MRKLSIIVLVLVCFQITVSSQSCLPEGIRFETQAQIDSFQINYPNCTEIEGGVEIEGYDIANLNGLSVLRTIGGTLRIGYTALTNLRGLESLTNIGGSLNIGGWSMNAMPFQPVECQSNPNLSDLSALSNLTSIGGSLSIYCNDSLSSLAGLDNLSTIGETLNIGYAVDKDFVFGTAGNSSLTSLTGLGGLTYIGGKVSIQGNISLESFTGLNSGLLIDGNMIIRYNNSLSNCESQSICSYLENPKGRVEIHSNALGCNSPKEIANACGISLPCLPFGNYYFLSQSDIDDFQSNYPGCTEIGGDIVISGDNDITNLIGLSELTSISGSLHIGEWAYVCNPLLTSLTGLEGLTSVGGLHIILNDTLASLEGLDNISAASITDVTVWANKNLSTCDVKSICDYLAAAGGEVNLHGNADGCSSQEEVYDSCLAHAGVIDGIHLKNNLVLYPNPAYKELNISLDEGREVDELIIYTLTGQQVMKALPENGTVDISHFQAGMYIVEVMVEGRKVRQKLLVE